MQGHAEKELKEEEEEEEPFIHGAVVTTTISLFSISTCIPISAVAREEEYESGKPSSLLLE